MVCTQYVLCPQRLHPSLAGVCMCVSLYVYIVNTNFRSGFVHVIFVLLVSFYVCCRVAVKNRAMTEGQVLVIIVIVALAVIVGEQYCYNYIVMYKFAGVCRHEGLMRSSVCQRWYGERAI